MALRDHPFFRELISLHLPVGDYVIAGSAPMLAHNIAREISDIDIVARGAAWKTALELGQMSDAPKGPVRRILLSGGDIEVLDGWFDYSVDSLIDEAEIYEGVRILSLARTLDWKRSLDRAVDRRDVMLICDRLHGEQ
ncbi:hypothetical protein [Streptomyces sp. NPDC054783]